MSRNYAVRLIRTGMKDPNLSEHATAVVAVMLGYHSAMLRIPFHRKDAAIGYARGICKQIEAIVDIRAAVHKTLPELTFGDIWCQVINLRTNQATHILPSHKSSCRVCGNELEGKLHCSYCKSLHSYR